MLEAETMDLATYEAETMDSATYEAEIMDSHRAANDTNRVPGSPTQAMADALTPPPPKINRRRGMLDLQYKLSKPQPLSPGHFTTMRRLDGTAVVPGQLSFQVAGKADPRLNLNPGTLEGPHRIEPYPVTADPPADLYRPQEDPIPEYTALQPDPRPVAADPRADMHYPREDPIPKYTAPQPDARPVAPHPPTAPQLVVPKPRRPAPFKDYIIEPT